MFTSMGLRICDWIREIVTSYRCKPHIWIIEYDLCDGAKPKKRPNLISLIYYFDATYINFAMVLLVLINGSTHC